MHHSIDLYNLSGTFLYKKPIHKMHVGLLKIFSKIHQLTYFVYMFTEYKYQIIYLNYTHKTIQFFITILRISNSVQYI